MPDLDKAWEQIKDKLPLFVATARKHGAVDVVPTSQSLILKELSPESSGWCYGLSMAYIIGISRGESPAIVIGNGYQTAGLQKGGADADKVRIGQWTGSIRNLQSHQHAKYQCEEDSERVGLRLKDWDVEFSDRFYRFTKVATALIGLGTGFSLVNSPNHSMAATAAPGNFGFYDPNFGAVTFRTAQEFIRFFVEWFDNGFIQRSYKGVTGGLRNAPPASSLVIKLRTWTR